MHEAAVAESILNIALKIAEENDAKKIREVGLKIGEMAGIEVEALTLSFDVLKTGTVAENAALKIKKIPIRAKCNKCGKIFIVERYNFFCPECDGILILESGRELLVEFVDFD